MKQITLIVFLLFAIITNSQTTNHSVHPFKNGEKLSYITSYNMKGLMTEFAGINMEVSDILGKKKPIFKFKFTANTLTSWDDYVKVRHAYQSYVEASSLKSLIMIQDSDVKGQQTKAKYSFKHKFGITLVTGEKNNRKQINVKIPISNNSYDIVSLLYLVRTLNYSNFHVGESKPFKVLVLERSIPVSIKYMGKKTINVKGMGNKECYKIGFVLQKKFVVEPNVTFMWITADKNRVPVLISTVYKEGKALVKLNNFEGLQYK